MYTDAICSAASSMSTDKLHERVCAPSSSSSTAGYTGALSVVTSTGVTLLAPIARSKNRWASFASRRGETNTSTTCPN